MATEVDIRRTWCKASTLNFTRYMFYAKTRAKFIVGDHHRRICQALDDVVRGDCTRLIINIAPRYSKTELVSKSFIAYGLAINPRSRFLHLSYSDDLVAENSREVNETCRASYYRELFPEVEVVGTNAKKWSTTAGGGMYAVATGGQVTGFGAGRMDVAESVDLFGEEELPGCSAMLGASFAGAIVIDDPIKPEDAISDILRERVNRRFENTIRSRVNSRDTPIIIIMQRLHEHDLCGYLQATEPGVWRVISMPCLTVDDAGREAALWPFKHTVPELRRIEAASPTTFETQYQQNPTPLGGLMYAHLREYDVRPVGHHVLRNYTDTADTGEDFLCSICYAEYSNGEMFITDVLYTQASMETTEPETARMLLRNDIAEAMVESNNGGRAFARNVERLLREMGNRTTSIRWFSQSANKQVRIFSHSAEVQNMIYFPTGWRDRWPRFATALTSFRKEGRNAHDDAPDALTGMVEFSKKKNGIRNIGY